MKNVKLHCDVMCGIFHFEQKLDRLIKIKLFITLYMTDYRTGFYQVQQTFICVLNNKINEAFVTFHYPRYSTSCT